MRQAAKHDLHTTEGLAQVQHLRFILPSGEIDTQYNGMTVRGGVLDDGILEMPGSDVIDGRCALQLPRLTAGCHRYDILVSGNGTDNPLLAGVIHVAPRVTPVDVDDNAPADYLDLVIPEDEGGTITVISESPAWVDDAVEKSLQERGVYITPVDGVTTLIMSAGSNERDFNFYTFAVNSTYISGHLSTSYKLNKITLRTPAAQNDGTLWRARLHKITNASTMQTVELGESNSTATWVSINSSTAECSWIFNAISIAASDRLVVEVYAVDASGATISKAFIAYGAAAAQGSTEGVLIKPEGELIWRNYTRLLMTLEVAYTDGVSVGGVELASKKHFDALTAGVAEEGEKVSDSAEAAQTAAESAESAAERAGTSATNAASSATAAQQALAAIPQVDAEGNMTLTGGVAIPAGQKITLSDGGATIYASSNSAVVHVSALASSGEISGNAVNCNRVAASNLSITTAATFGGTVNANGGINIPVVPSTDTEAARYREVRLLHEMEFSALRTYFNSSNPFSWGILVDRFWWAAGRDNMPAWTVVTADFNMTNLDNNNSAYDGLTSCYFPMSCGLGYGRCFDSIAIGNTSFNADYASLDDDPFATPAGYMRYWVDIQIGRPANGQCAVSVRMSRWDNVSGTVINTTHQCSVPDSLALRGVALSMTSKHSGVWLVGFNKSAGRLVSYKVLPETFTLDSYNRAMSSRLSLAKTGGHCSVGVHAPCYYGGTVLGEWCDLIQIN